MINSFQPQRREFLRRAGSLAFGYLACASGLPGTETGLANPVGYATISWPKGELDHALQTISHLGYRGVQFLGWVRSAYGDGRVGSLVDELSTLHLKPVALSCSGLKPDPAKLADLGDGIRDYATFLGQLHGKHLQVTDGGHPDVSYTPEQIKALGKAMNNLGKIAQGAGVTLGYHPHVATLGETRHGLGQVLDSTDPRYVKLIADVAHLALGGSDPVEVIRTYRERLIACHFKDVRQETLEAFKKGPVPVRHAKNRFCEIGEGVVDFPGIVRVLRQTRFDGWVIVELDSYEPRAGGPDESARMNTAALQKLGFHV